MSTEQVLMENSGAHENGQMVNLQEQYNLAVKKRAQLVYTNIHYQHRLAEYFRRKKSTESQSTLRGNMTASHSQVDDNDAGEALNENNQEQRYAKYISNLKSTQQSLISLRNSTEKEKTETQHARHKLEEQVDKEWLKLVDLYKTISSQAVSSRTGRAISNTDIENHIRQLEGKEEMVSQYRLENIKMTNKLKKQELQLKQKEELADGLHLIDFEQLKIENQTYNEKIEERNEELMKLHQKITNTVQVLTHYKEKLQFMETDSAIQSDKLKVIEAQVVHCRDSLAKCKQQRDKLRSEFHRLQQNAGLLGSIGSGKAGHKKSLILLKDFEGRQDEAEQLEKDIDQFKSRHGELTLEIKVTEKKLEKTKAVVAENVES